MIRSEHGSTIVDRKAKGNHPGKQKPVELRNEVSSFMMTTMQQGGGK